MRRALWSSLPFLAVPRRQLLALRDSVERWRPQDGPAMVAVAPDNPYALVRRYLLGLLSARAGDTVTALSHARWLATLPVANDTTSSARLFARSYAASLRAHVFWIAGRTNDALAALEPVRQGRAMSPDFVQGYDRFIVAELLLE